jgi:hypothetical protein
MKALFAAAALAASTLILPALAADDKGGGQDDMTKMSCKDYLQAEPKMMADDPPTTPEDKKMQKAMHDGCTANPNSTLGEVMQKAGG